jgi:hypothetical protein
MKVASLTAILFFGVTAVALAAPLAAAVSTQQNVCQPNPSPVDADDPSIIVTSPSADDSVTSPLTVAGEAHAFEGTVQLALFDGSGNEIASTFTMAAGMPPRIPFSDAIEFSVTEQVDACLWVFEYSAKSGDPVNVVQIALTLQPAGLPSTGGATPDAGHGSVWPLVATLAALGAGTAAAGLLLRRRIT